MERFDLAIVGSGSGNVVVPEDSDQKVALIEEGTFGGTCVNRGCIPTKMLAYTADLAMQVRRGPQFGLQSTLVGVEWPAIRDRVAARVAETSNSGREGRKTSPTISLFEGHARFVAPHELVIDDDVHVSAEQIVIATGGHPSVPEVVTGSGVVFHTSDSVMWLDDLPASMVILGGPDDLCALPHKWVPAAVFADPQVATVGARSRDLAPGSYLEVVQEYGDVAYGWAMGDPMGVCKIYVDPMTVEDSRRPRARRSGVAVDNLPYPSRCARPTRVRISPRPVLDPSSVKRGHRERPRAAGRSDSAV
jgi:mycothione reductase